MKVFVSWSGGKDCTLALYRFLKNNPHAEVTLLNMYTEVADARRAHGLHKTFVQAQAKAMNLNLIQKNISKSYEASLKEVFTQLKANDIHTGIFGDIYLQAHRTWIERVCSEVAINPLFPLWMCDTGKLLNEFIGSGFKTIIITIKQGALDKSFLGETLDIEVLKKIKKNKNVDTCGENGEYHTFVFDGPLFKMPVNIIKNEISERDNHFFLNLKIV